MNSGHEFKWLEYLRRDLYRYQLQRGPALSKETKSFGYLLGALSPRFAPILLARTAHKFYLLRLGPFARIVSFLNFFFFGIEIAVRCPIGPGLLIPHTQGTVIGANSIGADVTIFQGVTIGAKEIDFDYAECARPTVGCGVVIGSGAKILGGVSIGDSVRIGANSVVLHSVPPKCLVVGIPARIVEKSSAAFVRIDGEPCEDQ